MTKVTKFFSDIMIELRKASWPWDPKERGFKKYKELTDSTVVVFIAMILLAAFVSAWDLLMIGVMKLLTGS
ncbi:MAG: preprotein translocase subunit SecE [Verrucomicrobiae bacterium]|jgi:preprotein translocase subunit SecE|nr:preprotein translocase subunit SecE [Verrucomicrobiae bacterium]